MTSISGPVGIRNGTQQVANAVVDQAKVIGLLSLIRPTDGGKLGVWIPPPLPGPVRKCPPQLADAIRGFQQVWRARGELGIADGVVDPQGRTLRKLDALASNMLVGPGGIDPSLITFRQTNPANLTAAHAVTQQVIAPLTMGDLFYEIAQTGTIHEFLFEMRKDGAIYWIGAAVPQGTTDFSKAQVFFHPTVVQAGVVHAADGDYASFRGGWSGRLQRYVAMQGGQLAGARRTTLIVPFMTMAATTGKAPAYMFATRPTETLNAILTAVCSEVAPGVLNPVQVSQIGVSSFSSGIGAMRLFILSFGGGLIAETTDFDSPFIINEPKVITRASGAVGRVFSQVAPPYPQLGWLTMSPSRLRKINTFRSKGAHAQIGWMTFFMASMASVIG
jgi:hypothetical protein